METNLGSAIASPALLLEHEADHANKATKDKIGFDKGNVTYDKNHGSKEESRVILGSEKRTGQLIGDFRPGEYLINHNPSIRNTRVNSPIQNHKPKYPWDITR